MEKCYVCDCVLPEHSLFTHKVYVYSAQAKTSIRFKHSELFHCDIALAAAQGAVANVIDNFALKLGEQRVKEFAKEHKLTALIKAWSL